VSIPESLFLKMLSLWNMNRREEAAGSRAKERNGNLIYILAIISAVVVFLNLVGGN